MNQPILSTIRSSASRRMIGNAGIGNAGIIWTLAGITLAACGGGGGGGGITPPTSNSSRTTPGTTLASNAVPVTDSSTAAGFTATVAAPSSGNTLPTVGGTLSASDRDMLATGTLSYSAGNSLTDDFRLINRGVLDYVRSMGEWTFNPHDSLNQFATATKTTEDFTIVIISLSGVSTVGTVTLNLTYTLPISGGFIAEAAISDGDEAPLPADDTVILHSGGEITIADEVRTDSEGNQVLDVDMAAATFSVNGGDMFRVDGLPQDSFEVGTYRIELEIPQDGEARVVITDAASPADDSGYLIGTLTIDTETPANSAFEAAVAQAQSGALPDDAESLVQAPALADHQGISDPVEAVAQDFA